MKAPNFPASPALDLLKRQGVRLTPARIAVLDVLLASAKALTHLEIGETIAGDQVLDRVTLYRTLDWLVEQGFAHRIEGQDRVWRFNSAAREDGAHAHFHCQQCGTVFCLEDVMPAVAVSLPNGFQLMHAQLSLHGLCPGCRGKPT